MGIERFIFGTPALDMMTRHLDIQSLRLEMISSNLANVDTPEYKARDIDFEQAVSSAMDRIGGQLSVDSTNKRHIGGDKNSDIPVITKEEDDQNLRQDGNTVNQDEEMQKLAETQLLYSAVINAVARKYSLLNTVISNAKI